MDPNDLDADERRMMELLRIQDEQRQRFGHNDQDDTDERNLDQPTGQPTGVITDEDYGIGMGEGGPNTRSATGQAPLEIAITSDEDDDDDADRDTGSQRTTPIRTRRRQLSEVSPVLIYLKTKIITHFCFLLCRPTQKPKENQRDKRSRQQIQLVKRSREHRHCVKKSAK